MIEKRRVRRLVKTTVGEERCRIRGMERSAAMLKVKWSYLQRQFHKFLQARMLVSAFDAGSRAATKSGNNAAAAELNDSGPDGCNDAGEGDGDMADKEFRVRVMRVYQQRASAVLQDGFMKPAVRFKYVAAADFLATVPKFRQVYSKNFDNAFQKELAEMRRSATSPMGRILFFSKT